MNLLRKCIAEFIGAFAIVFAGCGAIAVNGITGGAITHPGIAAVFGLVVMAMIYATGHISGAHINPAVTLAFAATRHFPRQQIAPYVAAQLAGGIAGAALLAASLPATGSVNLGVTQPLGGAFMTALIWEAILTFLLMFVIMGVATDSRAVGSIAGLAIGGTVSF
jgi:glycerol uptake facilitator-like aquaporin